MIVALKTDSMTAALWLLATGATTAGEPTQQWESGRGLSDELLAHIQDLVHAGGHELTDVTGLVIFSGPGSFTSLRIGHAVANALADSLGVPVVGAQGEQWLEQGLKALPSTKLGHPALPHYGSEAHITRPKA
jgi:tRNA threonylcarbamoyladenosine biosynthesis protein TsaB